MWGLRNAAAPWSETLADDPQTQDPPQLVGRSAERLSRLPTPPKGAPGRGITRTLVSFAQTLDGAQPPRLADLADPRPGISRYRDRFEQRQRTVSQVQSGSLDRARLYKMRIAFPLSLPSAPENGPLFLHSTKSHFRVRASKHTPLASTSSLRPACRK